MVDMAQQKARARKPLLLMLYGFPGAGKTHLARNFVKHIDAAHVQADKIRHDMFEKPRYDEQEDAIVDQLMDYLTNEFLRAGISVVYDVNAMRKRQRHSLRELARKHGGKTLLVWFQLDPETAMRRLNKRDRRTLDDKYAVNYTVTEFRKFASRMQAPEPTEDYVVISGKHSFDSQKSAIFNKLMDMKLVTFDDLQPHVAKPGLVNLVPRPLSGRDVNRRINIR